MPPITIAISAAITSRESGTPVEARVEGSLVDPVPPELPPPELPDEVAPDPEPVPPDPVTLRTAVVVVVTPPLVVVVVVVIPRGSVVVVVLPGTVVVVVVLPEALATTVSATTAEVDERNELASVGVNNAFNGLLPTGRTGAV
jgi:hypothetical protein